MVDFQAQNIYLSTILQSKLYPKRGGHTLKDNRGFNYCTCPWFLLILMAIHTTEPMNPLILIPNRARSTLSVFLFLFTFLFVSMQALAQPPVNDGCAGSVLLV